MTIAHCPACGFGKSLELFRDYNRRDPLDCSGTYVQCLDCSLVYLADPPDWQKMVEYYSKINGADSHHSETPAQKNRGPAPSVPSWKKLLRKIHFRPHSWPLSTAPSGRKNILDIGCGNGGKLGEFAERGYDVWGIDIDKTHIESCRTYVPNGRFIQGELTQLGLPGEFFDYIRIDNTLEHIPDMLKTLRECYRILKKQGRLMTYVPSGQSLTFRFLKGDSISSWIPFHLQLFTRKSLKRTLVEAGFQRLRIYGYYPSSWLPLSLMQRKMRKEKKKGLLPPGWLTLACYPFGWALSKTPLAEELVAIGVK